MSDRRWLWAVLALTALAALLRALIVGQTTWGDELYLYEIVHDTGLRRSMEIVHDTESTPALYFVLAWFSAHLGGDDLLWIRFPALLLSVATVPVIYALGARTVGRVPALIAAALFAIAPFDLFYGTEGRAYAALAFFSVLSTLGLVRIVETGGRRIWVAVLAVGVAGAAYSHYLAVFVLAAQLVFALVVFRDRRRPVLLGHAVALLAFVPWIPFALDQFEDNTSERLGPVPGLTEGAEAVLKVWFGHPFTELGQIPGRAAMVVVAIGLVVAAAFAVSRRTRLSRWTALFAALAAATPVGAVLYELTDASVFGPRYFSASVPAGCLLIGALLAAPRHTAVVAACTAAVVGGIAVGTVEMLRPEGARPDYRAAAQDLDRIAAPGEPILELAIFEGPPSRNLSYFFERRHAYFPGGVSIEPAFRRGQASGRFHIVGPATGFAGFVPLLGMEKRGFRLVEEREWEGIVPVRRQTYEPVR